MATIEDEPLENLIPLRDVPAMLPKRAGKPRKYGTVRNWTTRGIRGIRLEHRMDGSTPCTTLASIKRFQARLAMPAPTQDAVTDGERRKSLERAEAALDRAGIK